MPTENFLPLKNYDSIVIDAFNMLIANYQVGKYLSYEGKPTGMLYLTLKSILKLRKLHPKAEIIILWEGYDSGRKLLAPEYKAQRPKKEGSFFASLEVTQKAISLLGLTQLTHNGAEADDLAQWYILRHPEKNVLLYSTDHDWYQFVGPKVDIMTKGNIYTEVDLQRQLGFPPNRIGIIKILTGDASDNVKGIGRFPMSLARRIAMRCRDYREIPDFPFSQTEEKWKLEILKNWAKIEINAKVLLAHPEWLREESMVMKMAPQQHAQQLSYRMELLALLKSNGIKSMGGEF